MTQAAASPYARIGGDAVVVAIVDRFYDRIEQDPAFAPLRAIHSADLAPVRHALARFLCGWLGGPRDWFDRGNCVMSLHHAFPVTPALADLWATAMTCAIAGAEEVEPAIADAMAQALGHMARGMVNLALRDDAAA